MRTSNELTQNEIDSYQKFADEQNLAVDGEVGVQNAERIAQYIGVQWNEDITVHTLQVALDKLRDRLVFLTPVQIDFKNSVAKYPADQQQTILSFVGRRGLLNTGDDLLVNASVLASYLLRNNWGVSDQYLDSALLNIVNSRVTNQGAAKLRWKSTPKQGAELEREQQRAAAATTPREDKEEMLRHPELTLAPHLREHKRTMHLDQSTGLPKQPEVNWQAKADAVTTGVSAAADRNISRIILAVNGQIDWKATHDARVQARADYIKRSSTPKVVAPQGAN